MRVTGGGGSEDSSDLSVEDEVAAGRRDVTDDGSDKETSSAEDNDVLARAAVMPSDHEERVARLAKQNAERKKRIVQLNAWTTNSSVASKTNNTGVKTRKKGGGGDCDFSDDYDGDVSCAIDLNSTSKVSSVKSSELKRTTSLPKRTSR